MKVHEEALKKIAEDKRVLEKRLYQTIGNTILDWQRETGLKVSSVDVDIQQLKTLGARNVLIINSVSAYLDYEGY
jgi:hypothetical protein